MSGHSGRLRFDGRELLAYRSRAVGDRWWWEALAEGATLGNPEPVERSVASLARDGARVVIDRYENRAPSFQVVACGVDAAALQEAETALFLSCQRPVDLEWTPPSGYGATTVYQVQTSRLDHVFDDFAEMGQGVLRRSYVLRMNAAPFGRGVDRVVIDVPAGPAEPVMTSLDTMGSAAGWVAEDDATVLAASDSFGTFLRVRTRAYFDEQTFFRRTAAVVCEDWVRVQWSGTRWLAFLSVDGEPVTAASSGDAEPGLKESWFFVGGGTHTLGFGWSESKSGTGYNAMNFYDLSTTDSAPYGLAALVQVPGSARAPWLLRLGAASGDLGETVVTAGPRVGKYDPIIDLSGPSVLTGSQGATGIPPGDYILVALLANPKSGTVTIGGQTTVLDNDTIAVLGGFSVSGGLGGRPGNFSASFTDGISDAGGVLLLLPVGDDHQTVIGTFTGQYLFVDPPDLTNNGGVFVGNIDDGSDGVSAWGQMLAGKPIEMAPPTTAVWALHLTADNNLRYPSIQISGYPHFHTHAGGVREGGPS